VFFSRIYSILNLIECISTICNDDFNLPRDGGVEDLHRDPNSWATPQDLDQKSKMEEVVLKMARRRGSDAGQPRRRSIRSCKGCPQALQEEFSFCFILHRQEDKRRCDRGSEVATVHSG